MSTLSPDITPADGNEIARQAAEWLVRFSTGECSESDQRDFELWKQADPRHAAAAEKLQGFLDQLQGLRGSRPAAHAALEKARQHVRQQERRLRQAGTALVLTFLLLIPGWLVVRSQPFTALTADVRTEAGQWETRILPDQSRITLNSGSAINLHYDAERRGVELVQGEVLVDVAPDAARPFVVETRHGRMQALGTRFVVRRDEGSTVLAMLESRVRASAGSPMQEQVVSAGEQLRLSTQGLGPVESVDVRSLSDAWARHQLVVQDRPLPEVLAELSRHRPGWLRYDAAALATYRVSAVLPLDDTDRALQLLAASFPLDIQSRGRWLTQVRLRPPALP